MTVFPAVFDPFTLILSLVIVFLAGSVKGLVGFALPMVVISGLGTFLPADIALAGLILPTLVTNMIQALRQGAGAALGSVRRFRVFLLVGLVFLLASAQLFRVMPASALFLFLGISVTVLAMMQLIGLRLRLDPGNRRAEAAFGAIAGGIGGISGVWGPITVLYLTALNTTKADQMRVQGVIYGLGALALVAAHVGSGVLNWQTLPFSALLVIPAVIGMWLGGLVQDRIDQETFRRATLFVLLLAGLNLVRRALLG